MVSKKNFPQNQNGRVAAQPRQMPYKKPPMKPPMNNNFNNPMFNVSQIPDNPGYLDFDFNLPPNNGNNANKNNNINTAADAKKKNNKNKPKNGKPQQSVGVWKNNNQGGGPSSNPRFNGPRNNFGMATRARGNRMIPPGPRGMGPPMGFQPPMGGFQPPMMPPMPMRPPMPPMGMGVQPPPPPFMRRNGPMPPIPPMIPPRMIPPAPFIAGGKIKKNKLSPNKKVTKGKGSTVKTLKNLINQYPIDKPWVTSEIREEHDKKVDIENRLKGNKDDELFAQFKVQRDKFVAMYEAAREEYLKKEAASVKAKDEKDKQTNTTKKDDKKEANTNENKKN